MVLLKSFIQKPGVQAVLGAVKPCVIGIILATGLEMAFSSVCNMEAGFAVDFKAAIVAGDVAAIVVAWRLIKKKKASPIALIIVSACLGMLVYGM